MSNLLDVETTVGVGIHTFDGARDLDWRAFGFLFERNRSLYVGVSSKNSYCRNHIVVLFDCVVGIN